MIGDSHTRSIISTTLLNDDYVFHLHHMGPVTIHRVGRDGLIFLDFAPFDKGLQAFMISVFWEIDVRCHILKQRDLGRDVDEIIHSLVDSYFKTLRLNCEKYPNITCIVASVVPPTNATHNPEYPIFGTLVERIDVKKDQRMLKQK